MSVQYCIQAAPSIDLKAIKDISRQIAIDWPTDNKCQIVNGFGCQVKTPYFTFASYQTNIQEYNEGDFWAKGWEAKGGDPNTMKLESPAIMMEYINSTMPSICAKEKCFHVYICLVSLINCPTCCDNPKTSFQRGCDMEEMMDIYVSELLEFEQFFVLENEEPVYYWLTLEKADFLAKKYPDKFGNLKQTYNKVIDCIKDVPTEFNQWGGKINDLEVGKSLKLTFCGCKVIKKQFKYDHPKSKPIGHTKCPTC